MVKLVRDDLPACPRAGHGGAGWKVVRDGANRANGVRPRQRYRCVDPEGNRHSFTPVIPRERTATTQACYACGNDVETFQGNATLPGSEYELREVADALLDVAKGVSYAEATRRVQLKYWGTAGTGRRGPNTVASGQTVANWVDRYAPVITDRYAEARWCNGIALDSTTFMYTNTRTGQRSMLYAVLAAAGYPKSEAPRLFGLHAVPRDTKQAWTDFLRTLPGKPAWVMYDGDKAIKAAVRSVWGLGPVTGTTLHVSEHHLYKNAKAALVKDGEGTFGTYMMLLLNTAFHSTQDWTVFTTEVRARGLPATRQWVNFWDKDLQVQVANRHLVGKYSTGGVEPALNTVKDELSRRSWTFRNQARMNLLLGLLRLRLNRQDDTATWTQTLQTHFLTTGGKHINKFNRDGYDLYGDPISSLRA